MNVWPAMVTVPVRAVVAVFAATANVTVPLALPPLPLTKVIQLALLTAVHAHPVVVVTAVAADPPVAGMFCEAEDKLNVQLAAA